MADRKYRQQGLPGPGCRVAEFREETLLNADGKRNYPDKRPGSIVPRRQDRVDDGQAQRGKEIG